MISVRSVWCCVFASRSVWYAVVGRSKRSQCEKNRRTALVIRHTRASAPVPKLVRTASQLITTKLDLVIPHFLTLSRVYREKVEVKTNKLLYELFYFF